MKNSLQFARIFIICWLGFGIISANAATISNVETGPNSALNHNEIAGHDIDSFHSLNNPAEANETSDAAAISSEKLQKFDESIITTKLLNSDNTVLATVTTSSPSAFTNVIRTAPSETASLHSQGTGSEADNAENSTRAQELELYAILLVCLGLMCLTARRRRDVT